MKGEEFNQQTSEPRKNEVEDNLMVFLFSYTRSAELSSCSNLNKNKFLKKKKLIIARYCKTKERKHLKIQKKNRTLRMIDYQNKDIY